MDLHRKVVRVDFENKTIEPYEKRVIVKEGVVSRRWGTAVMEEVEHHEELGEFTTGMPIIPIDLTGKRVRVTIEVLEEPS